MKTLNKRMAVVACAAITATFFFLFYATINKADQKNESNFVDSFEEKFVEELNNLVDLQETHQLNSSDFWFFPETMWRKDENAPSLFLKPISLSVAAQVKKTLPRHPVRRYLRCHNIWSTAFRDISQEPDTIHDAAQSSLNFWRAMSRWEWAKPDPLLDPFFTSFLAHFEHAFTWYEQHLGIREDEVIKLSLVFELLPFPEGNILDVKGFFQLSLPDFSLGEKEILTPPSRERLIARVVLSKAKEYRYASDRVAKQAFRILMDLYDAGRDPSPRQSTI